MTFLFHYTKPANFHPKAYSLLDIWRNRDGEQLPSPYDKSLKLLTNAIVRTEDGIIGLGVVIRDHFGKVVKAGARYERGFNSLAMAKVITFMV